MYYISTVTLFLTIILLSVLVNSKPIQENNKKLYKWEIDNNERKRLIELLNIDFNDEKIKNIKGTIVDGPRMNCNNCGKKSELIDFVHTSIKQNIHSKEFMIKALKETIPNSSPPHELECSNCENKFLEKRGWATGYGFQWIYRDVDEDKENDDKNIIIKNKFKILTIIETFIIILLSFLLYIEKNKNYYELILNNININNNRNISLSYEYTGLVDMGKYSKEDIEWDLMFSNMPLRLIYNDSNSVIDLNKYVKSNYQEIYTKKKYHFLHCINVLRKFLRTVQNGIVIHKEEMQSWHLNHCVNYLKNVSKWDIYDEWGVKIPKPDGSF